MTEQESPYDIAKRAATEFPPTLPTKELEGKTFCIKGTRLVTTKYGQRHVAVIQFDDNEEDIEAWLGGVRVDRQLAELQKADAFPAWFSLARDTSIEGEPYMLVEPSEAKPQAQASWMKRLTDLGKEHNLTTEDVLAKLGWGYEKGESARAAYKRVFDGLIESTGDRESAAKLVWEELTVKLSDQEESPFV